MLLIIKYWALFMMLWMPPSRDFKFSSSSESQHMVGGKFCETRWKTKKSSGLFKLEGEKHQGNVFYSYYESRRDTKSEPIIIYFGDSPGIAHSYQMMQKPGPCWVDEKKPKWPKDNYWSLSNWADVLYVDLPRTGFTQGNMASRNREDVSEFMHNFVHRFYSEFPNFYSKPVYVWGVGYGAQFAVQFVKDSLDSHGGLLPITELVLDSPLLDLTTQFKAAIDHAYENDLVGLISPKDYKSLKKDFAENYEKRWAECSTDRTRDCIQEMEEYQKLWKMLVDGDGKIPYLDYQADPRNILNARDFWTTEEQVEAVKASNKTKRYASEDWQWRMGIVNGKLNDDQLEYQPFNEIVHNRHWQSGEAMRSTVEALQSIINGNTTHTPPGRDIRTTIMSGEANLFTNPLGIRRVVNKLRFPGKEAFNQALTVPILEWTRRNNKRHSLAKQIGSLRESPNLRLVEFEREGFDIGNNLPEYASLLPLYFDDRFTHKSLPTQIDKELKHKDLPIKDG